MIGHMYHPCLSGVIVPAEEIIRGPENHIAGRDRDIRVPAQVIRWIGAVRPIETRLFLGKAHRVRARSE